MPERCSVQQAGGASDPVLILFDCDGTLTDSHLLIVQAMQQAFISAGLAQPEAGDVNAVIGLSLRRAVLELLSERQRADAALLCELEQLYREYYVLAECEVGLFPGVRETLETLCQRGYWLGVVTGKSRSGLLRVLQQFDLESLFLVWRTADCTHSKPHPAMVQECMQELGVSPQQTRVVGDAVYDMQMAQAARVMAWGVSFGVADAVELRRAGAVHVVDAFADLLDCFPVLPDT